ARIIHPCLERQGETATPPGPRRNSRASLLKCRRTFRLGRNIPHGNHPSVLHFRDRPVILGSRNANAVMCALLAETGVRPHAISPVRPISSISASLGHLPGGAPLGHIFLPGGELAPVPRCRWQRPQR